MSRNFSCRWRCHGQSVFWEAYGEIVAQDSIGRGAALSEGVHLAHNTLVAMTLLIAESRPPEKSVLVSAIVNLIVERNP